jgi:hypothetical protein
MMYLEVYLGQVQEKQGMLRSKVVIRWWFAGWVTLREAVASVSIVLQSHLSQKKSGRKYVLPTLKKGGSEMKVVWIQR